MAGEFIENVTNLTLCAHTTPYCHLLQPLSHAYRFSSAGPSTSKGLKLVVSILAGGACRLILPMIWFFVLTSDARQVETASFTRPFDSVNGRTLVEHAVGRTSAKYFQL